jgi:hypothetical protein
MVRNSSDDWHSRITASVSTPNSTSASTRNFRREFIRRDYSSMGQNRGHSKKNVNFRESDGKSHARLLTS